MSALLNILSVMFGVTAVLLPVAALLKGSSDTRFSLVSLCACCCALVCQIGAFCDRIDFQDWPALLDTYMFIGKMSSYLMITVIVLNVILYHVTSKRKK